MTAEIEVVVDGGWCFGAGEYGTSQQLMPDGTWKRLSSYDRGTTLKQIIRELEWKVHGTFLRKRQKRGSGEWQLFFQPKPSVDDKREEVEYNEWRQYHERP